MYAIKPTCPSYAHHDFSHSNDTENVSENSDYFAKGVTFILNTEGP